MSFVVLPLLYIRWHYTRALRDMLGIWWNMLWFVGNLFSVATLFRTLIQPLKLMQEEKGSFVGNPARYFQNLLVNVIMRIVGTITRLTLIVLALAIWTVLFAFGGALFLFWFVLPLWLIGVFGTGLTMVFA